jgi:hypothetical protein
MKDDDLATEISITPLGEAYIDWIDSREPRTHTVKDLGNYGELAAFSAGWQAALDRVSRYLDERKD